MSMPAFQPRRVPRPGAPATTRARLSVVPLRRTRAPRIPFLALVTLVLVGGVVGLLMFNTSMQQASFAESNLEEEAASLTAHEQSLKMELEQLRDPQRVARAAQAQGMVLPSTSAFVRPDGTIVGKALPATREDGLRIEARPAKRPGVLDHAPVVVRAGEAPASQPGDGPASR